MTKPEIVQPGVLPAGAAPDNDANRPSPGKRRPWRTPALQVFGRISTLTQSASGCATSDNPTCVGTPGANMGPIPRLSR